MTLTIWNRLKICFEVLTSRSGHKHPSQEKQLSLFKRGYKAGLDDTGGQKMNVELDENEIKEIAKCLRLEVGIWEFRRGLSKKPSKEEKFTVKLWKKFGYILNQIATDKKVKK